MPSPSGGRRGWPHGIFAVTARADGDCESQQGGSIMGKSSIVYVIGLSLIIGIALANINETKHGLDG